MSAELQRLVAAVNPGDLLALPADYAGVAMAATYALIAHLKAQGRGDLRLLCVPTGGLQGDLLIGAGLVAAIETSAMTLGEAGGAPQFAAAVKAGRLALRDATCPAIHAGLMAAQKGSPFVPLRGLIGSDLLRHRPDWQVIDNPFAPAPDPVVLIPALQPDVALFHVPLADREGNVWIGRRRELAAMAYAARTTLVTAEKIVEGSLLADEVSAAGVLPALYVSDVAEVKNGAWPYGLWGRYPTDTAELQRYARMARSADGFADYLAQAGRAPQSPEAGA